MPITLGASVGVGSFLWHTYPTMTTLVLEIVPILVFISWFIWLYTRNVVGMRPSFAVPSSGVLYGAPAYTPGLVVTLALGAFHAKERTAACFGLHAAGVYLAALYFRTIDNEVCPVLPIGTHFIWHFLIGLVTYLAMRPLILSTRMEVRARVR